MAFWSCWTICIIWTFLFNTFSFDTQLIYIAFLIQITLVTRTMRCNMMNAWIKSVANTFLEAWIHFESIHFLLDLHSLLSLQDILFSSAIFLGSFSTFWTVEANCSLERIKKNQWYSIMPDVLINRSSELYILSFITIMKYVDRRLNGCKISNTY